MERARLRAGSLLKLRGGRGVWHAEGGTSVFNGWYVD